MTEISTETQISISIRNANSSADTASQEYLELPLSKKGTVQQLSPTTFKSSMSTKEHSYLISRNISTRFADVPSETLLPDLNPSSVSLSLEAKVSGSGNVALRGYIMFYSDSQRLKTTGAELTEDLTTSYFDVPEHTTRVGLAVRVSGAGTFEIETLTLLLVPQSNEGAALTALDSTHTDVLSAEHELVTGDMFELGPSLRKVVALGDPFMTQAILRAVSGNPASRTSVNDVLLYLLRNKNEYAAIEILDALGESFGPRRHRMRMDALSRLLRMDEVVTYFENLPSEFEDSARELRFYLKALAWVGQIEKMKKKIRSLISQPNPHGALIDTYLSVGEVLENDDLAAISQIMINKGARRLHYTHVLYLYDLMNERGMIDLSLRLSPILTKLLKDATVADRINRSILMSNLAYRAENYILQEKYLNDAMQLSGLLKVSRIDRTKPISANNIQVFKDDAYDAKIVEQGPKVTVLMTAWSSGETLPYAVQSILDQTYKNLELIIIDDASPDDTPSIIAKLAKQDPRITPIYLKKNGGTYVAKNHGLKIAQGQFVLCQDSDDWAHPEKIHRLVTTLQESPDAAGVEVGHIRISETEGVQRKTGGYLRRDASSLTYEKDDILETFGFYDSVRAGADGEFKFRIERIRGRHSVVFLRELLSIVAWESQSLSGSGSAYEISKIGVFAPTRLAYRQNFQIYHEKGYFESGLPSVYMPQVIEDRKFEVPAAILPDRK